MTSKNSGIAQLGILIGLVVMAVALPVASILVSKNQDNRNRAAGSVINTPTSIQSPPTLLPTTKPSQVPLVTATPAPVKSNCPGICTEATTINCPSGTYTDNRYYCTGLSNLRGNCCIRPDGELTACKYFFGCSVADLGKAKKCLNGKYKVCMALARTPGGFCRGWSECIY